MKPGQNPAGGEGESVALSRLRARFSGAVRDVVRFRGEETAIVAPGSIVEMCRFLKEDPELAFALLSDLCATHFLDREYAYEVNYQLYSFKLRRRLRLKVRLGASERLASVTSVWSTANWHEREAFDLVGVEFEGHPDLRRILMPEDYDAHPLRRDFDLAG